LEGGTASLAGSIFQALDGGVRSQAETSARDCLFIDADLEVHAPIWQRELVAWIDGCRMTDSDLVVSLENSLHASKAVDVLLEDVVIVGGHLELDLQEAYEGAIVVDGASISGHTGYGVVVKASGIDGELTLGSMDIEGPWGVQAQFDYSGMRIINSTIDAEQTAVDLVGDETTIPAYLDGVTLSGALGLRARTTVVKVTDCDLSSATVPVTAEEGSAVTLTDCQLDESSLAVDVRPNEDPASIKVDRHLVISGVRWLIGDTIDQGSVLFYVYSEETLFPTVSRWEVGSHDRPLVRLLEWTKDGEGFEERLVFDDVRPVLNIGGTTFEVDEAYALDPWGAGPFVLVFVDEVNPWLSVSGVPEVLNQPTWLITGTCGDEGTGIDAVEWSLYTPLGELLSSGEVDILQDGRWQTTIEFTGAGQTVQMRPVDRSGNEEIVPLQAPEFDLPNPTLTVARPEAGSFTNAELITVSGTADFHATEVHVQVLGHTEVVVIPVVNGHYSRVFELPQEGLNDLVISSHDNFDGFDEKRVPVYLDTIAPAIVLAGLDPDGVNYVNGPSLVISGTSDDPRATITVLGQELGLVEKAFATTVSLASGRQTIKLVAKDVVGNENIVNLDVVLDTTPPTVTLVNPSTSPFWSAEAQVEVIVDVDEPVEGATVNGEPVTVEDGRITLVALLSGGANEYDIRVVDRAGNVGYRTLVMRLDTTLPVLGFVNPQPNQVVNTTAVPMIVTTLKTGCSLYWDDGTSLVPIDTVEQAPARLVGTMYLPSGEGERTVAIVVVDRAGHVVRRNLTIDIDTIAPFLRVDGFHRDMKVTTEPLKVTGWTEPGAKVVWVNGQMARLSPDGRFSTTIELEEGWQDVRFLVLDRAGNSQEQVYRVKALGEPKVDPPVEALAVGTILLTMGALAATTEVGRWTVLAFFIPLYTKLRKDKILDQRTRGLIQGYITANPGANYTIIRDNLDLADGTLTYHLQVLEREGFVYSIREGLFRCFYPQGVPPPRRGKLHLSDVQADIVRVVKRIPGITVGEIATAMNRRPNVISYHLKLLKEGGLVRMEEDGRHVRVYPIDTAVAMI
jgi:predicted transcriptional regulator